MLDYYKSGKSLENLLIGKTSLQYMGTINEMMDRKILYKPTYNSPALNENPDQDKILNYILEGIR